VAELPSAGLVAGATSIDNDLYNDPDVSQTFHADDRTEQLATLHLLNSARIPYFDRVLRQQLQLAPTRAGTYLEVGCGGGVATCALAALGYEMTGVDPAAAALEAARAHARNLGLQQKTIFAHGSAYDLSAFPSESFDGVVMADVMEHLLDLPAAVREVDRVLRPGGVLVFSTINRTYRSYLAAITLAQDVFKMVPPDCHDWRLFVKPHELSFLLQAHRFLVDTSSFRGMAPTLRIDPAATLTALPPLLAPLLASGQLGKLPPPPLSDFMEIASLEVNFLGWAQKPPSRMKPSPSGSGARNGAQSGDAPPTAEGGDRSATATGPQAGPQAGPSTATVAGAAAVESDSDSAGMSFASGELERALRTFRRSAIMP